VQPLAVAAEARAGPPHPELRAFSPPLVRARSAHDAARPSEPLNRAPPARPLAASAGGAGPSQPSSALTSGATRQLGFIPGLPHQTHRPLARGAADEKAEAEAGLEQPRPAAPQPTAGAPRLAGPGSGAAGAAALGVGRAGSARWEAQWGRAAAEQQDGGGGWAPQSERPARGAAAGEVLEPWSGDGAAEQEGEGFLDGRHSSSGRAGRAAPQAVYEGGWGDGARYSGPGAGTAAVEAAVDGGGAFGHVEEAGWSAEQGQAAAEAEEEGPGSYAAQYAEDQRARAAAVAWPRARGRYGDADAVEEARWAGWAGSQGDMGADDVKEAEEAGGEEDWPEEPQPLPSRSPRYPRGFTAGRGAPPPPRTHAAPPPPPPRAARQPAPLPGRYSPPPPSRVPLAVVNRVPPGAPPPLPPAPSGTRRARDPSPPPPRVQPPWRCTSRGPPERKRGAGSAAGPAAAGAPASATAAVQGAVHAGAGAATPASAARRGGGGGGVGVAADCCGPLSPRSPPRRFQREDRSRVSLGWPFGWVSHPHDDKGTRSAPPSKRSAPACPLLPVCSYRLTCRKRAAHTWPVFQRPAREVV
jgi:hypothetical protein